MKDFPAHVAQKFSIQRIELWSQVFPSTEPRYVGEFRGALGKAGSAVVDIAVDGAFSQYSSDKKERERALAFSQRWIDVAAALGSPSIRTHLQRASGSKPDAALAADNLRRTADYAAKRNVVVHLENDDPVSEDPFFIVQVIEKVNSPWLRALPDFGNTVAAHDEAYAYRAIDAMFAHAYGICHVKNRVTDAQGKAIDVDLARTFAVLKRRGFKGYCSMEYDAPGDPYHATSELIQKTTGYLS
jgi:sugar phosphate isomerase/epimerase